MDAFNMLEADALSPRALQINHISNIHDDQLIDPYFWLRDPNWPEVQDSKILDYLRAENDYTNSIMNQQAQLTDAIFQEIKSRIPLNDYTVPYQDGDYEYYARINDSQQYWVSFRKHIQNGNEEVILDQNELGANKDYFALGTSSVSPDDKLVAYSVDDSGAEHYTIMIKDILKNSVLIDNIPNTIGSIVWANNSEGFYYTPVTQNWRTKEVRFHSLGEDYSHDELIYLEPEIDGEDSTFQISISQSSDEKLLYINAHSKDINEIYFLDLEASSSSNTSPSHLLHKLVSREQGKLYHVAHHNNYFYAITNDLGPNFRLVSIPKEEAIALNNSNLPPETWGDKWQEVIAMEQKEYLLDVHSYANHLVLTSSSVTTGLKEITVYQIPQDSNKITLLKKLTFLDPAYNLSLLHTTFNDKALRYKYSSLRMPSSVFEINFADMANSNPINPQGSLLKKEFAGSVNPDDYTVERLYIPSEKDENIVIPVSLIKHKATNTASPLLLYGYGSYGIAMSPFFRPSIFSLLDRGFTFAIAHIRGGDELGRTWYESAKFLNKKNTFEDFISVAKGLVDLGYTDHKQLIIHGGSAGGMLVGACLNMAPSICAAAVADVPFVDVLNTMLDSTLPLTPGEFKEWGNPSESYEYYNYIKSYSPYDNVRSQQYPALLVTAGLYDPRVTYWEPAKWVAKLRYMKTDNNPLLFKIDMTHGHKGASGRFDRFKEIAFMYTFMLMALNRNNEEALDLNINKILI